VKVSSHSHGSINLLNLHDQHSVEPFVKKTAMAVQRSSALKELSAWMYQLLVWVQYVDLVQRDILGIRRSVMVHYN
jgi:hypothetical protein